MSTMRIGLIQSYPSFGDVDSNVDFAAAEISRVEADLVVLPELFNTGYQFVFREEVERFSEEIPLGKTCQAMMSIAEKHGLYLVFGLAEREGKRLYNSAAVVGPKGFIGRYRKTHLFEEEKLLFDPGDSGFQVFDTGPVRIGVMICFDWLFPESARILGLMGAEVLCHPANLVLSHCQQAMLTRSLENGLYSVTANRIGTEARGGKPALTFTGNSQIVDPAGEIVAYFGADDTGVLVADIDPETARDKSIAQRNDRFKDRRPEFYRLLARGDPGGR